jgi:hypothetical protein
LSHSSIYFHSIARNYSYPVLHYATFKVSLPALEAAAEHKSRPTAKLYLAAYKD